MCAEMDISLEGMYPSPPILFSYLFKEFFTFLYFSVTASPRAARVGEPILLQILRYSATDFTVISPYYATDFTVILLQILRFLLHFLLDKRSVIY